METGIVAKDVCVMEDSLNKQILEWWYQLPDKLRGNKPTFIHQLNKNAEILFVGLNPSGITKEQMAINEISEKDIEEKIKLEQRAIWGEGQTREGQYKSYYGPLNSIADELQMKFEHCDLFHMSYRTAKVVKEELYEKNGDLKPLHQMHLSVFIQILNYLNPKVVITNNVISANILKKYLDLKFDKRILMYKNSHGQFFFLSGIMSYGRLTIYDRERLVEIIKRALNIK
ncbi:hypothetical protein [Marinilabilia salmonicolor]|uniref:hypothetical protein n=1 Tax=Marinilabilia salmonicolor TaxID=989 RepID=UPI00029B196A|nr:hypothetical protein [Marinilabilia salmonicolor]